MNLNEDIKKKLLPISNATQKRVVVKTMSETDKVVLNNSIETKIQQNKSERNRSIEVMRGYVIGGSTH